MPMLSRYDSTTNNAIVQQYLLRQNSIYDIYLVYQYYNCYTALAALLGPHGTHYRGALARHSARHAARSRSVVASATANAATQYILPHMLHCDTKRKMQARRSHAPCSSPASRMHAKRSFLTKKRKGKDSTSAAPRLVFSRHVCCLSRLSRPKYLLKLTVASTSSPAAALIHRLRFCLGRERCARHRHCG
jgi:hypothetical protein